MSLKTRYNLWKAQGNLSPDRQFKAGLFKKLNVVWDNTYNVKYAWYQTVWFKYATGFASVVLMAGSLGTGAYAYTSPKVTEGSVLYPIKEKLENIEEIAKITPEARAKFYLKKIERREAEFEAIKKRGDEKKEKAVDKQIEQMEKRLELAGKKLEETQSADNTLKIKVKDRLEKRLEKHRERQEKQLERKLNKLEKQKSSRRVRQEFD
jgi:hypothetical protein